MDSNSLKRYGNYIYSDDLSIDRPHCRGNTGQKVVLIQEWLCLHGIHVVIDGVFGPATEKAVKIFQNTEEVCEDGIVGNITFAELIKPMTDALSFKAEKSGSFGNIVVECARAHLRKRARETGVGNQGPWVRLYLEGWQGVPWCAGFVSFILKQAAFSIGEIPPVKTSFSCDLLAKSARLKNVFLRGQEKADRSKIKPGSLFLNRKSENDWNHTGIVTKAESELFYTIEGNSNDTGESEGCEVCERIRGYGNKDFILT